MVAMATRISAAAILIGALATGANAQQILVVGGGGSGFSGGPGRPLADGSGPGGGGGGSGGGCIGGGFTGGFVAPCVASYHFPFGHGGTTITLQSGGGGGAGGGGGEASISGPFAFGGGGGGYSGGSLTYGGYSFLDSSMTELISIGGENAGNGLVTITWPGHSETFNYTGAAQSFDVATAGVYDITAYGAQGGGGFGGQGAEIGGGITLDAGDRLTILVGGAGAAGFSDFIPDVFGGSFVWIGAGGGGGTFVVLAPEPSTWAMMLIGFAGLGFAAYRRARAEPRSIA